jgi:uncharacterized RDD family membrane protein YckC
LVAGDEAVDVHADTTVGQVVEEQRRGIVTPEAVVLEFETAGVSTRGIGFLIDLLLQGTVLFVLLIGLGIVLGNASGGETIFIIALIVLSFVVLFGYPAMMETFWGGRTLGHAAMGLRVVTREGAPTRFRHSAIRSIFRFIEGIVLAGAPAILSMTFTSRDQRLGDLVAGTIVLRERSSSRAPVPVQFAPPAGYEAYAASLDVSGITAEQYALVRAYLLRFYQLAPEARAALGLRLANPLAVRMHHAPPPMITPEVFLACAAATYQQRSAAFAPTVR